MNWLNEEEYMKKYGLPDYKTICTNDIVCWMNYKKTGIPLSQDENGIMKVVPWGKDYPYIDSFLVEVPTNDDFICAFEQIDGTRWAHVTTTKWESNLDIWETYVFGADDSSYTCHYLTTAKMEEDLAQIKERGIIAIGDLDFFFTN